MSTHDLEVVLAKLYSDEAASQHFLNSPDEFLDQIEASTNARVALQHIDRVGLVMASRSFHAKRQRHFKKPKRLHLLFLQFKKALKKIFESV